MVYREFWQKFDGRIIKLNDGRNLVIQIFVEIIFELTTYIKYFDWNLTVMIMLIKFDTHFNLFNNNIKCILNY